MAIAYVREGSKVTLKCPNPRCVCHREKRLDVTKYFPNKNEIGKTIRCSQCSTLIPIEGIYFLKKTMKPVILA